jgi:hypothetical protein
LLWNVAEQRTNRSHSIRNTERDATRLLAEPQFDRSRLREFPEGSAFAREPFLDVVDAECN